MAIPIYLSYFPGLHIPTVSPSPIFRFLEAGPMTFKSKQSHSVCIRPTKAGVPWPSSFPVARQCRHWRDARASCAELLFNIHSLRVEKKEAVPEGFALSENAQSLSPKEHIMIDTAVNSAVYMVPNSPSKHIQLIAQLFMLLFTHDDVVEYQSEQAGSTVVDVITNTLLQIVRRKADSLEQGTCVIFRLTTELLAEHHALVCDVIEDFCSFVYYTQEQHRTEFNGLRDFMDYRETDIAANFISSCVRLGNKLEFTTEEARPLQQIFKEASDHILLVNDLFSYDKEKHAAMTQNAMITNSVHYLEKAIPSDPRLAKDIAMLFILDYETKLEESLRALERMPGLTNAQLRYAHAMIESAAGNLLFSLTSVRYGKGHGMVDIRHHRRLPLDRLKWTALGIATIFSVAWGFSRGILSLSFES